MLFNSFDFILIFLPVTWLGFWLLLKSSMARSALSWLICASICFYGWWNWRYVPILIGSGIGNFYLSRLIAQQHSHQSRKTSLLWLAVTLNLAVLGYLKYANFFLENLAAMSHLPVQVVSVALPLGISFYTFQQIAYLVDSYRGEVKPYSLQEYLAFVTFFPHCIAGPLVHPQELLPQMAAIDRRGAVLNSVAPGLGLFAVGLVKKTLIADTIAPIADTVFNFVAHGGAIGMIEGWLGAIAYTLQLYFDFSAYSDMACGLTLLFGLRLPVNFFSPYRATSIIDFWRRWHITLSRFLRKYLYYPLGGNRKGKTRRYLNLMVTMLLGGLWHGAAWTFVIWGGLHGVYLVINHAWRHAGFGKMLPQRLAPFLGWLATFIAVICAWVFFRASSADVAWRILMAMVDIHGFSHNGGDIRAELGVGNYLALAYGLFAVLLLPNMAQVLRRYELYCNLDEVRAFLHENVTARLLTWQPTLWWSVAFGCALALGIAAIAPNSAFLYFDF